MLATFLNGLINDLRGKKDGPQAAPESRLNNNIILRKLKIALNLRDEDICELMDLGGLALGKAELSAFFRKVGHRHYRDLQDQMLRKFIQGLQFQHRGDKKAEAKSDMLAATSKTAESKTATSKTVTPKTSDSKITTQASPEQKKPEADESVNSAIWNKSKHK